MTLGIPFLRAWRIRKNAAKWHLELIEGATPERRAQFEAWLAADPEHVREYSIFETYSELSPELAPPVRHRQRHVILRPAYALAVAIVILVGGALLFTDRPSGSAYAAVTNAGPAIRMVQLADGSRVTLDTGASLSVALKPKSREIELHSGRARFRVAPDPQRPFIVATDGGRVTSSGGEFDVAARGSQGTVVSRQGTVSVETEEGERGPRNLSPGEAVRVDHANVTPITVARNERLWPAGRLSFDQTPLSEIAAMANRLGGRPIHVADAGIGAMQVTAVLDLRDTGALARKLAAALDLHVQDSPDRIMLTR